MLDPNNAEVRRATLGKQVEYWLEGDIGRYITERATQQIAEALEKLKGADPDDPKAIRGLQIQIAIPERVMDWLRDAIIEGAESHQNIVEEHNGT